MQSGLQFLSILASGILSPDTKTMLQVALKLKRQLYKEGNLEGCVNVTTSKEGIELGPEMKLEKNRQFVGKESTVCRKDALNEKLVLLLFLLEVRSNSSNSRVVIRILGHCFLSVFEFSCAISKSPTKENESLPLNLRVLWSAKITTETPCSNSTLWSVSLKDPSWYNSGVACLPFSRQCELFDVWDETGRGPGNLQACGMIFHTGVFFIIILAAWHHPQFLNHQQCHFYYRR